ncbi:MAG: hypothetical protein IJK45_08365 [Bacteroidaceae bacterium]|nr:hypothetical protein [Bacteroidaceae bacterium]
MTKYQLYRLIEKTEEFKDKRHPMFERNKFMKFLGWFMIAYYAALMLIMGVSMGFALKGDYSAAYHRLDGGFYWLLIIDFWTRFIIQETPAQKAQQYALLPIRRSFLMKGYLIRNILSWGNMFWGFFLIPFGLVSVVPMMGWWAFFGWLLGYWLLFVFNGLCYLFVRALCMKHMLWFLLPLALHAILICVCVIPDRNVLRVPFVLFMNGFVTWNILSFLTVLVAIAIALWANYRLQMGMVYNEIGKKEDVQMKSVTTLSMFNRYGALGEYLKMEVKLRLRNKQVKTGFFVGLGLIAFFSLMLYFTDVYDGGFMKSFICLYDYVILGVMTLVGIMCYEGNYIDGLMSRRDSIYDLLRAKYYFNSILLLLPFIFILPLMINGKISVWMNIGYMLFTVGALYPCVFQLAVYNKNTLPLNVKLMKSNQGTMMQNIVSMVILFLPLALEKICVLLLGPVWGYMPLITLGVAGILTHRLWLRNIYKRMMVRRYENMEGFRASRNS